MAGGRTAPSADKVHCRANRAGPVAGWTWRDARRTLQFGKKEGSTSVVLCRNGEARFHFPTPQLSASSAERAVGQQSGAPTQQQKQRANRVQPMQQPTTDTPMESESLSNSQHKSAARLQKFNLEMAAILISEAQASELCAACAQTRSIRTRMERRTAMDETTCRSCFWHGHILIPHLYRRGQG